MEKNYYSEDSLFDDCTYVDDKLYFFSKKNGFLEEWDKEKGRLKIINTEMPIFYSETIISNNKAIYSVATAGKKLLKYDLGENSFKIVAIDCGQKDYGNILAFFIYAEQIVIIPRYDNKIYLYSFDLKRTAAKTIDIPCLYKIGVKCANKYFIWVENKLIIINLDTLSVDNEVAMIEGNCPVNGWAKKGEIYFLEKNGTIHKYDKTKHKLKVIKEGDNGEYSRIVVTEKNIILLPNTRNHTIKVFDETMKEIFNGIDIPADYNYSTDCNMSLFYGYEKWQNHIVFAKRMSNYLLKINDNTGEIDFEKMPNIEEDILARAIWDRYLKNKTLLREDNEINVRRYISYLKEGN